MNVYLIRSCSLRLLHDEIAKIVGSSTSVIRMNMDEITIDNIIEECLYDSLLQETKYVVINNFKLNKDSSRVTSYFDQPNPNTVLILITDSIDKRSVIYKTINKNGHIIEIDEIKDINNKINNYAKAKNISIDYLGINKLLEYNLENYDLVLGEIDKISLITNKITITDVEKYSSKLISEENFEFCDVIIKKEYKKMSEYLDNFISLKQELTPFIALLASQYRIIYAVKSMNLPNDVIAKELGLHPYRVKLASANANLYTKDELQKKLLDLCDLDYQIKTSSADKYMLFKIFVINV